MSYEVLNMFKTKANVEMLWDVLLNELNVSATPLIENLQKVFETQINLFIKKTSHEIHYMRAKHNIMDLNKEFLSHIVSYVKYLYSRQNKGINKITILDEEAVVEEPYKIEDIHASRQSIFEREVEQKRIELETFMVPQKPTHINFADNVTVDKITSMDTIIADKIAQRNAEIGEGHNNNNNNSTEEWLKPIETSVDKHKKVSWNETTTHASANTNANANTNTTNIFNKLKQYSEQKSTPLPQVSTISNEQASKIQSIHNLPREPILTTTEIIKQLNETNKRIDNLQEMLVKITNIVEKTMENASANASTNATL
jgi:hypothetical protein